MDFFIVQNYRRVKFIGKDWIASQKSPGIERNL
jgi:hypothetical protein